MADITGWPSEPLDWSTITFREPVPDWTGLSPEYRMVRALWEQQTGGVPFDPPEVMP